MAAPRKNVLVFPTGGIDKKFALQFQRPFTTPDAANVRSNDTLERRERGGSRPGLGKAYALEMGALWTANNNIAGAGTITDNTDTDGTTELSLPVRALNGTSDDFDSTMVGLTLRFLASGNEYLVVNNVSASTIDLLGNAFAEDLTASFTYVEAGSQQINMATLMRSTNVTGRSQFSNEFSSGTALGTQWTAANYPELFGGFIHQALAVTGPPIVSSGWAQASTAGSPQGTNLDGPPFYAALLDDLGMDDSAGYVIGLKFLSTTSYESFTIYAKSDGDVTGNASDYNGLVVAKMVVRGGISDFSLIVDSTLVATATKYTGTSGWFELRYSGASKVFELYVSDTDEVIITYDASGDTLNDASQVGFGLSQNSISAGSGVDIFQVSYTAASGGFPPDGLMLASGGILYRESTAGTLAVADSGHSFGNLAHDRQLMAVDRLSKLYIADNGAVRKEDKTASPNQTGSVATKFLDDSGVLDWTQLAINVEGDVVEISNITTGAGIFVSPFTSGVFGVSAVHATNGVTLKDLSTGTDITDSDTITKCNYRILRGTKVYDSTTNTLSLYTATAGSGDPPIGCDIITLWLDRIVMAGDPNNPGVWYMSQTSDPLNWDYLATVLAVGDAVASISTDSDVGGLSVPITALIAYSDDYLIIGTSTGMWLIKGDPILGNPLTNISYTIGIVDKLAWTIDANGRLYWLSREGVFTLGPGAFGEPQEVSERPLPQALKNVNVEDNNVSMAYDSEANGIHIFVSSKVAGTSAHYFMHIDIGAFWPIEIPTGHDPAVALYHPTSNAVMLGCRDGFARKFDDAFQDDDGTEISSRVLIGPIALGRNSSESGLLESLQGVLDDTSGDVDWSVHLGDTPEEAFNAAAFASGTWSAGLNYLDRPSGRGSFAYVRLANNTTTAWSMDYINLVRRTAGGVSKR